MTPGALTASERRAETVASLFKTVHPPMPEDPELRFRGDLGLGRGRPYSIFRDGADPTTDERIMSRYTQSKPDLPEPKRIETCPRWMSP